MDYKNQNKVRIDWLLLASQLPIANGA